MGAVTQVTDVKEANVTLHWEVPNRTAMSVGLGLKPASNQGECTFLSRCNWGIWVLMEMVRLMAWEWPELLGSCYLPKSKCSLT